MLEKRWIAVSPQSFTANGNADGQIKVFNSTLFKVKQIVILKSNAIPSREDLEVKRITDKNTMYIGPIGGNIDARTNMSAYLVVDNATIAANEQKRSNVPEQEIERHTYEEEPVVARRVIGVDQLGNSYSPTNPEPVKTTAWWDEVDIQRDFDDDITTIELSKDNVLVETIDLEYNGEKSVIKVTKS